MLKDREVVRALLTADGGPADLWLFERRRRFKCSRKPINLTHASSSNRILLLSLAAGSHGNIRTTTKLSVPVVAAVLFSKISVLLYFESEQLVFKQTVFKQTSKSDVCFSMEIKLECGLYLVLRT